MSDFFGAADTAEGNPAGFYFFMKRWYDGSSRKEEG